MAANAISDNPMGLTIFPLAAVPPSQGDSIADWRAANQGAASFSDPNKLATQ